jgi:hypothetical protein
MPNRILQRLHTLRVKYSGTSVGSSNVVSKENNLIFVSREKKFLSWKNYTPSPEKLNDLTLSDLLNIRHR